MATRVDAAPASAVPRTTRPEQCRAGRWTAPLLLTLAIFVLSLPGLSYRPIGGLDASYRAAIHMALDRGVRFGGQIVYTFGPLGFLGSPTAYDPVTYAIAVVVALVLQLALVGAIVVLLLRLFGARPLGLVLTALAAYPVARLAGALLRQLAIPEMLTLLLVLACLELLRRGRSSTQAGLLAGVAALGAAGLLVKFNSGVVPLAAVGVTAVALPTVGPALRTVAARLAAVAAGAGAGLLGLWLVAGQRLGDLLPFVRGSLAISAGHVEAMAIDDAGREWEYVAAAVLLTLLAVVAVSSTWTSPRLVRVGMLLVLAGYTAALFRHGFVRHDAGHAPLFFVPMVVLTLPWLPAGVRVLNGAVTAVAAGMALAVLGGMPLTPEPAKIREVSDAVAAIAPARHAVLVAAAREQLRGEYALSGQTLELLRGHTVHVEPWETALLWAYPELRWGPVPVFQAIVAYTAGLDDRNAELLASAQAPEFILAQVATLDGHHPMFESPAHMLALVCHYESVAVDGAWQVLRRGEDRCGDPVPAGGERLAYGAYSTAPPVAGDQVLVARFTELDPLPGDRLRTLLLKPSPLILRGARDDPAQTWRFVRGHAANPHAVNLPDCLGWDPRFLAPEPSRELTLSPTDVPAPGGWTVTYEAIPFACPVSPV